MTRRDRLYQIRTRLQQISPDAQIPNRLLDQVLAQVTQLLVRRDSDSRKVWRQTDLFKTQTLTFTDKVSDQTLPDLMQHGLGDFIQVLSTGWTQATAKNNLYHQGNYFYVQDNRVVITSDWVTELSIRYWSKPVITLPCQSALDIDYPLPDHLEEAIIEEVVKQIATAPLSIPPDTYPNQNELDKQGPRQS